MAFNKIKSIINLDSSFFSITGCIKNLLYIIAIFTIECKTLVPKNILLTLTL